MGGVNNVLMTVSATIRPAVASDLEAMLKLAEARRSEYAKHQPIFWRPAPDAVARQRPHLARLIQDDAAITVVADTNRGVAGFAIGTVVPAPPVYDPGGPTCIVDDFIVDDPERWPTIGVDLLRYVRQAARRQAAAQIVVVCGHLDGPKRTALEASGLSIASNWWVTPLGTD